MILLYKRFLFILHMYIVLKYKTILLHIIMHVLTRVIKKIPQNDVDSVVTPANNPAHWISLKSVGKQ